MISTVTVNFKTADYVETMLESLFKYHNPEEVEVFVVENGSGDDLSKLTTKFPQVNFIFSNQNLGFARGCNLAIEQARGEVIALINPDIVFTSNSLKQIEQKMKQDADVGVAGVSLKNVDGSQQNCVWHFSRPIDQLLVLLKAPHLFKHLKSVEYWRWLDFDYSRTQDVDQVMGAFFAIKRELLNAIGPLDPGFFIWYEEVDYCRRAANAGWKIRYYADIGAQHKGGSSFDRVLTIQKQKVIRQSLRRYMKKHHGSIWGFIFTALNPLFVILALIASVIKPK
ncbi:glycosyltransferase family 2 protein [Patescibacteria group bacterium]|nr:glycosyltransferase family 2 protein [Patescibacteria group bacterium]MBU1705402.1 glycosyltransferase family 2 protein [Patescibacteria group bacterium]